MGSKGTAYSLLVVDDEPLALNLIERTFAAEADMDVRVTTSPIRGLEIADRQELDLIITDQRMPEMDGLAFLGRVRERRPRAHRILLTAYPEMEVALRAINDGLVYRFVLKPWDLDDMRVSVRRAVEAKRLADAHESMAAKLSAQFDELVRAERLATIGRLSAGVGHELANAATPLLMNAQWLGEEVVRLRELFRACAQAVEAGFPAEALEKLTVLTGRMQERNSDDLNEILASIGAAGMQMRSVIEGMKRAVGDAPDPAPYDLNQGVLSAVSLLRHRFKSRIELERDLTAIPAVLCRGPEIAQVLLNLLVNAADAVESSTLRTVRVRTWERG
ncbi:MAG: response regulator, partial [Deltaproteobacteria bacterium]